LKHLRSTHYLGLRDRAMLELLYSSGLKVNELLGLDVEDLFLDLEFLKVRSKRERMVPMTSTALRYCGLILSRQEPDVYYIRKIRVCFPDVTVQE